MVLYPVSLSPPHLHLQPLKVFPDGKSQSPARSPHPPVDRYSASLLVSNPSRELGVVLLSFPPSFLGLAAAKLLTSSHSGE